MGHFWGHQFVQPQTCSSFGMPQGWGIRMSKGSKTKSQVVCPQRFAWRKMLSQLNKKAQGPSSLSLCNWEGSINRTNNEEPADRYALMQEKYKECRASRIICAVFSSERSNKNIFKVVVHSTVIKLSKSRDVYICYICLVTKPLPTGIVSI